MALEKASRPLYYVCRMKPSGSDFPTGGMVAGARDFLQDIFAAERLRAPLQTDSQSTMFFPMCGRFRLSRRRQIIEEYFDTSPWDGDRSPRYDIAPTQPVPVIRRHPRKPIRQISSMRWGLVPHWTLLANSISTSTGGFENKSQGCSANPRISITSGLAT
jgi:hypothetical protein